MSTYSIKAMLLTMAAAFVLAGCAGAGSNTFVMCESSGQPMSNCKTVTSGMKCLPQLGTPGGAIIKCK